MKLGRLFVAVALAFSLSAVALGEDKKKEGSDKAAEKPACCAKAEKKGETCKHECCVEAAKADPPKACEKCSKPKKEKQESK